MGPGSYLRGGITDSNGGAVDPKRKFHPRTAVLSLSDVSTAFCPGPKSQMIDFPRQPASPTTTKQIITAIPMPSQLSIVENIAVPQRATTDLHGLYTRSEKEKIRA